MKQGILLSLISALLLIALPSAQAAPTTNNCFTCHGEVEDNSGPAHLFRDDIHFQRGLGCQDCHGGDPTLEDMDAVRTSKGFRGVPDRADIPDFCARCHSDPAYMRDHDPSLPVDQLDKYKTSVHGIRLFQHKDLKVATCVSCHTAHRIGDARMPHSSTYPTNLLITCGACHNDKALMAEYGIPTDQVEKYRNSVHGQALLVKEDLSAPVCNDCHGNHGAAPPDASSLSDVCGNCHAIEASLYQVSPHRAAFAEQSLPMCETCHGNHDIEHPSDALIGLSSEHLCGTCHSGDEPGPAPRAIDSMRVSFATLTQAVDSAKYLVAEAGRRGMMTSDEEFALGEIDQTLIHLRSGVHAATLDSLTPKFADGMIKAAAVQSGAAALIDEYYFRRWGLGVASGIITLLALALYLKIRRIDEQQKKS